MADLTVITKSGQHVPVSNDRTFVIVGSLQPDPAFVGVGGQLVKPGTREVIANGRLLAYIPFTSAIPDVWGLAFDVSHINETPDDTYDLIVTAYRDREGKTSEAVFDEVVVIRNLVLVNSVAKTAKIRQPKRGGVILTPAAVEVGHPLPNTTNSGSSFLPYGTYTNNDKPISAQMKNSSHTVNGFMPMCMENGQSGSWSISFPTIPAGSEYTLTVNYPNAGKVTVEHITIN